MERAMERSDEGADLRADERVDLGADERVDARTDRRVTSIFQPLLIVVLVLVSFYFCCRALTETEFPSPSKNCDVHQKRARCQHQKSKFESLRETGNRKIGGNGFKSKGKTFRDIIFK